MHLSQRHPSANWEPIPIDPSGQRIVWAWFRPPAIPEGLIFTVPAALFADATAVADLSLKRLVSAVGLAPSQVLCWSINGMNFDACGGTSPLLDRPLPAPRSGGDLSVSTWIAALPLPGWTTAPCYIQGYATQPVAQMTPPMGQMGYAGAGMSHEDQLLLEAIESNWKDVLALEVRIASLRKEIGAVTARLSTLNRDLNSHERLVCTSKDLGDWADCRRALRDAMTVMSRSVKEIDLGTTSGAGKRHLFEEIHQKHVVQRLPFPGIKQAVNEFETYRKILQSVIGAAQASLNRGGRDAEMPANSFLQKVHAKAMAKRKVGKFLFSKSFPPPG